MFKEHAKTLLKLKFLQAKRSMNKNFDLTMKIFSGIIILFLTAQFGFLAYYSDEIISMIYENASIRKVIFQITPIIIFASLPIRLIMDQSVEESAINLYKIGSSRSTTIFYHIIFNLINIFSVCVLIIFTIVGIKNFLFNNLYGIFFLYLLEVILTITIYEFVMLSYKQYFRKKFIFPSLGAIAVLGGLFWYLTKIFGFPLPVHFSSIIFISIPIFIFLLVLANMTTRLYLTTDITTKSNNYKSKITRGSNTIIELFLKYITRTKHIRNNIIMTGILIIGVFSLNIFANFQEWFYAYLLGMIIIFFSEILIPPDYKWIGYLHSGIISVEEYIANKMKIAQIINLSLIIIHLLLYIVFKIESLKELLMIMIFYSGTLPYFSIWIELKAYKPRDPYQKLFEVNSSVKNRMASFPILLLPVVYIFLLPKFSSISSKKIFQTGIPLKGFLPFLIVGILGIVLHSFWIDKLTEYYKKKRYEIFNKSEAQ